jgi:hypothetical protein
VTDQPLSPAEQVRRLYEEAESRTASAMENLVSSEGFAELLAMVTQNAMAMTKVAGDSLDTVLANLRMAGRNDIARLGRQLARTEDKLERLLQAVEGLQDLVAETRAASTGPVAAAAKKAATAARKVPDKKAPASKTTASKATATKATAIKATASKATARRTTAKKAASASVPRRTATARRSPPRATVAAPQPDGPAA